MAVEDHQYHPDDSDAAVGYPVLEIDEDGSLSVSIAREMSALFDSLSSSGATRTVGVDEDLHRCITWQ